MPCALLGIIMCNDARSEEGAESIGLGWRHTNPGCVDCICPEPRRGGSTLHQQAHRRIVASADIKPASEVHMNTGDFRNFDSGPQVAFLFLGRFWAELSRIHPESQSVPSACLAFAVLVFWGQVTDTAGFQVCHLVRLRAFTTSAPSSGAYLLTLRPH